VVIEWLSDHSMPSLEVGSEQTTRSTGGYDFM